MTSSVIELRDFYQTPLGVMAERLLRLKISSLWPNLRGERVLVLGFGLHLLSPFADQAADIFEFMPAVQGVCYWPLEGPNRSCLVDFTRLPLLDNSFDRIIAIHVLEGLAEPGLVLREIHRVLKSGGRFLAIVANRRGLWAHSDNTPFGNGRPYSTSQIKKELRQEEFSVERLTHALYVPPTSMRLTLSLADKIEKSAAWLCPGCGGLILIEASKQLYAPLLSKAPSHGRTILPLGIPSPSPQAT